MKNGVSSPDTVNDTNVLKDEEDGDKLSSYKFAQFKTSGTFIVGKSVLK